jgi:hypothetical protein
MLFAASGKRRFGVVGRHVLVASAALLVAPVAHAQLYSEAVSGDLSNNRLAPTSIGTLGLGSNVIVGTSVPTNGVPDQDYLTFTVAAGQQLTGLTFGQGTNFVGADRLFLGIAQGSSVNVDPNFAQGATGLLGWTLVGSSLVGTNVLPALGLSAPPNFAAIPGATGFTGPLGAGIYSIWLQDGDNAVTYNFNLQTATAPVPEPASWMMMISGFGLLGARLRRFRGQGQYAPAAEQRV